MIRQSKKQDVKQDGPHIWFSVVIPMFLQLVAMGNNTYKVIQYNYWQETIPELEF